MQLKKKKQKCHAFLCKNKYQYLLIFVCLFFFRVHNGPNNNPTCLQFFYTYRRLLSHINIKSNTGNCLTQDSTNMLNIDNDLSNIHFKKQKEAQIDELEAKINLTLPNNFNEFSKNVIGYLAGFVVKKIKEKVCCPGCLEAISCEEIESESHKLIQRKSRGGLIYPTRSVQLVCEKIERKIQTAVKIVGGLPPYDILILLLKREAVDIFLDPNIFISLENHV